MQRLVENEHQNSLVEAIFEANPSGVAILVGTELHFVFVNPAYRYLLPDPMDDPVGKTYERVWPRKQQHATIEQLQTVLQIGRPLQLTGIEHRFRDGTRRFFNVQARRFDWEQDQAVLLILWDVTEQKLSEKATRSIAFFTEQNPNPILRISPGGFLLYANISAKKLLKEMHVGRPAIPSLAQTASEVYQSGVRHIHEYETDGHVFSFEMVPNYDGGGYINLYGQDISAQKQAEQALREREAQLKQALEDRNEG